MHAISYPGHGTNCNGFATRPDRRKTLRVHIAEASPFKGLTAYASIEFRIAALPRHDYLHVIAYTIYSQYLHGERQEADLYINKL
jgi:hypothetical protein